MRQKLRWALGLSLLFLSVGLWLTAEEDRMPRAHAADIPNPAEDVPSWGEDHVGQEVPEYMTGTECLFCHRDYVGPNWQKNAHYRNLREPTPELPEMTAFARRNGKEEAAEVSMLLGSGSVVRYLKRLPAYGKSALHEMIFREGVEPPADANHPGGWNETLFAEACAGCHMTAIDTETVSYGSPGMDCYVCHGVLEVEHAADPSEVIFAKNREEDPRVGVAICGQCHLRGGQSRSTGRPYPNNFVAGDDLLRDFQVDWSDQALGDMDMIEAHIFASAREVLVLGKSELTCIACHSIHGESTANHKELAETTYCALCHLPGRDLSDVKLPVRSSNKTCQF